MKVYKKLFSEVASSEKLFAAWEEFAKGKWGKRDVRQFYMELEQHIFVLAREVREKTYRHGPYHAFMVYDPKLRHIHKATVRDRIVHHAVFKVLYRIFEPTFIADSFSCRLGKGTHKGVTRVQGMIRQVTGNDKRAGWVLKCDVKKFFDSVDHAILLTILQRRIKDSDFSWLVAEILGSYSTSDSRERERE